MIDSEPTPTSTEEFSPVVKGYFRTTRTAWYGFLTALPLIVGYEVMVRLANSQLGQGGVRIGPEVWLKNVPMDNAVGQWVQAWMLQHGIASEIGMLVVIALVGLGIYLKDRSKRPATKLSYGIGVVMESALLAFVVSYVAIFATQGVLELWAGMKGQEIQELSLFHKIGLSLGAGIYEELVFRVIVTGGLFLILKLFLPRVAAYIIAALVGALLFSWIHYTGSMADEFELFSFTFRAMGGLILNALFLARGFGVAAWTHALYDVYVFTGVL